MKDGKLPSMERMAGLNPGKICRGAGRNRSTRLNFMPLR